MTVLGKKGFAIVLILALVITLMPATSLAASAHWVKKNGKAVAYVKANGKRVKGWYPIGKSLYYFNKKTGTLVRDKTVQKIPLLPSGKAVMTTDAKIKYKCLKILAKKGVLGKSKSKQLKAAWQYCSYTNRYAVKYPVYKKGKWKWGYSIYNSTAHKNLRKHGAGWVKKYALEMLNTHRGNCYGYACEFSAFASTIGYDPYVVCSRTYGTGNRDGAGDGYSRHAWVKINGRFYDPEGVTRMGIYVYGKKSYPKARKSTKLIRYNKVDGSGKNKSLGAVKGYAFDSTGNLVKGKLVKKNGKYYYYSKKTGKKVVPKNRVVFYKNKYYYFDKKGKNRSGLWCIKGKLYRFQNKNRLGYQMTKEDYTKMQNASKEGKPYEALKKLIGNPKSRAGSGDGCYGTESGTEWTNGYAHVKVYTFTPKSGGEEKVISVE